LASKTVNVATEFFHVALDVVAVVGSPNFILSAGMILLAPPGETEYLSRTILPFTKSAEIP
jgi:hypothetical protein